jgi:phosphate transport system substrate-binding protein
MDARPATPDDERFLRRSSSSRTSLEGGHVMRKRSTFLAIAAPLWTALLLTACSTSNPNGSSTGGTSAQNPATQGSVKVSGSSTVLPISQLVAEQFSQQNPDVQISVDGPGTTDGFVLFCKGQTAINDASRPIADEEITACRANGVDYLELPIAYDGITVMTNPANTAIDCLSKADLYALVGPESKGFTSWSDANALDKQLGGTGNFPNEPLDIVGPGQESGTWGSFIDLALKDIADQRGAPDDTTRPDYQSSANDNVIIQGVEGSSSSLGWVGFAYAEENAGQVKILGVSPDEDRSGQGNPNCVSPSRDTISGQTYPLSRTLYLYVNKAMARSDPAVSSFVGYYMSDAALNQDVQQVGYVDLPSDKIQASQERWASFTGEVNGA